jgi:hypothetical protein
MKSIMSRFRRATLGGAAAGLMIAAGLAAPATAANAAPTTLAGQQTPTCAVSASPNTFIESGLYPQESSIAFIITVECQPTFGEQYVEIHTPQLNNACHKLTWYSAMTLALVGNGEDLQLQLDDDGNATAVVVGGPSCAASWDLIEADLTVAPYTTATTQVQIAPPRDTQPGVFALPAWQVEDATTSSVATVFYVEFPSVYADHTVEISDAELYASCAGQGITWVGPNGQIVGTGKSMTTTLDDNGNAFLIALAGPHCATGNTLVQAELTGPPYTTLTTQFTVLSPRPTV